VPSTSSEAAGPTDAKGRLRYEHVYDLVLGIIETRGLREGDKLPSNAELAQLAGVSVMSVRRALDELAHAGRIVRHQGVGTFVAPGRIVAEPSRPGALLGTMEGADAEITFSTRLLSLIVGLPSPSQAEALGVEPGEPVWEISRLRLLDDAPKILEKAVLPLSRVPAMDEKQLAEGVSLYDYLGDKYGLVDEFTEQTLQVDRATPWERESLHLAASDPVVRLRGLSSTADSVAFDCYEQTYPAHEFTFYMWGCNSPRILRPGSRGRWSVSPLGQVAS